jgi:DNA-directed RNA polymerase specialized sigma24 family protein
VVVAGSSVDFAGGCGARAANWEVMARRAPEIVLGCEERAELERRAACYTLPQKVVQRAKLVLYAAEGLSNVEIAARLDSAPEVVGRWRSRFAGERMDGLEDRARSGRPRRFPGLLTFPWVM